MNEPFSTRSWAESSPHFYADLDAFFQRMGAGFKRLSARQFAAPWHRAEPGKTDTRRTA